MAIWRTNFELFRQEVDIFFTATKTTKKSKAIQVARLLNIIAVEASKIYFQIKEEIEDQNVSAILEALRNRTKTKFGYVTVQILPKQTSIVRTV